MAQNSSGGSQRHPKPAIFPQVATGFLYRKGKQPKQGKPATSSPQTQKETASNGQNTRNEGSSGSQHSNLGVALEQRTSNSQSAGDTTSKPTFRHALQNPLTVDWPVVPLNVENAILACVVRLLVDVAQYHIEREKLARRGRFDRWKAKGIQRSEERKRRGKAKEQPSANETETSESMDATGNGQEKNEGAEVKAPKRKRTEESDHAEAGDTSITTNEPPLKRHKASANQPVLPTSGLSRPAVLDHLIIGLNEVTKQLEVQSFAMRNPLGTVSIPTSSQNHTLKASKQRQAPIRLIVVCRPDVDSPTMIAHFPTLVAACNSRPPSHSKAKSENPDVILVGLPYGAEATLADASGLRRLSVLAFDNATPGLDCLDSLLPSIPVLQADWLTVQPASTAPTLQKTNYVPTHIKHIRTTAPKDIRQAKKKRSEERSEAKARKAVKRLPKVVLSTQSEGQGTPGPSGSKTQTSSSLLLSTYDVIETLEGYLAIICPQACVRRPEDSESFTEMLDGCIVARQRPDSSAEPIYELYEPSQTQSELIIRAQKKLLIAREKTNVLVFGFRLADERDNSVEHVVNFAVNTNVEMLRNADWSILLERVGDTPMFHMLTKCSIFVPVGNECYVQLTGTSLSELVASGVGNALAKGVKRPTENEEEPEDRPAKRIRKQASSESQPRYPTKNNPMDMPLQRARLFYCRPSCLKSGDFKLGFPLSHCLSRVEWEPKDTAEGQGAEKLQASARHLSKYVFPRQYNLHNAFTDPKLTKEAYQFLDYQDREDEILFKGPCKTPKRLKPTIPMFEKMIKLQYGTKYRTLCNFTCPSKLKPLSGQPRDTESAAFTDMMNEIRDMGTPFQSQAPNISAEISHPSLIIPHGASQAAEAVKSKPRFADYACSFSEVSRFIAGVTMAVIPHSFWGSKKNLKAVLSQVSTFISCRRFETITLHDVLQGLSTADCDWLVVEGAGAQSQRSSASDDLKKKEIFHEFLYWYFESFVSPLLKNTFYITDSSVYRNQVLYFRQDDWATLCTPLLERLSNATFVRLELTKSQAEAILRHRQLGYARVRLLPKDSGVRPIVNLRRKSKTGQSINQVLQTTFQILTFEKDNQPDLLGASVFGVNEIYSQLKAYRKRILRQDLTLPKLYFVKVDVRAAFDTIDQEKLISILHHILSTDDYNVRRWSRIMQSGGKTKRSFHRKAGPSWKDAQFLNFAESLAKVLHHAVFVDQVAYKSADKEQVLELLEEHIEANLVKIGPHFYRQKIGIPQGSVLSTLLCSFFYGDMEQKKFHFRNDPRNLLLRYVDDYLFVTTKLSMALHFLDVMTQGHPEYGCFISKDKTLTNFECEKHQPLVTPPGQRDFTWCGLRIDMTNLHVQADYERFQSTHLSNTLTVYRGKNPGVAFRQKMQHATKLRSHIIYLDTSLNGRKVVYTNIFQNLAFTAMKMHSYLKSWGSKLDHRQNFILRTILQCVDAGYAIARKRFGEKLAKRNKANFTIQRASFVWLGLKAFHVVLSRKSSSYPVVLEELKKRLERPGPAFQMKLRRIAKAAMDPTLTQIVY